jgi:hypothetical protein
MNNSKALHGLMIALGIFWAQMAWSQNPGIRSAGSWDLYLLEIRGEMSMITLNMELYPHTPAPNLPNIMIVSQEFPNCVKGEFPDTESLDAFSEAFTQMLEGIGAETEGEWVGSLVYHCSKFEYLYVRDTIGLRERWQAGLQQLGSAPPLALELKADPEWGYYREFLYPNEYYRESMANQKVLLTLLESGDDLSKPRKVEHWLYFPNKKEMSECLKVLAKEGYQEERSQKLKVEELPFELVVSRTDPVDLATMNGITLSLRKMATESKGRYDGWETFVVK